MKNKSINPPNSTLLLNVDLLRGIAALGILFWHFQHFYYPEAGVNLIATNRQAQPLFDYFSWLYLYGGMGVQFFWVLSGFIFFHVYEPRKEVSGWNFFSNRFSRLYPLHLFTLIVVALLQIFSLWKFGHFQIYPNNNWHNFLLNLFMASHWGYQEGWSFNAPIWSISVEILIYLAFFVVLKGIGISLLSSFIWFLWSLIFYHNSQIPLLECAVLFSMGGVINQLHRIMVNNGKDSFGILFSLVFITFSIAAIKFEILSIRSSMTWVLFPSTIAFFAFMDHKGWSSGRLGAISGKITYASYLIHIPVQIILIMFMDLVWGGRELVGSGWFLFFYLCLVIFLSWLVYTYIEAPAKSWLRIRMSLKAIESYKTFIARKFSQQ